MECFVQPGSIVREIWGKADTILFIFAGAAAEFSLNKSVDWLYFTGRLPADPIGRLFSTVGYARQIIFSEKEKAHHAIDKMRMIHAGVEASRGYTIPDGAYRDVLYMLIHYSIASYELLERKLMTEEKKEIAAIFLEVGGRMGIRGLPDNYETWFTQHKAQLKEHLVKSDFTTDLYKQYKKHLGSFHYRILLHVQSRIAPQQVLELLSLDPSQVLPFAIGAYKISKKLRLDGVLKSLLLLGQYQQQIKQLNRQ